MQVIHTDDAPSHTGPVPQAVEAGGWIYVSALFGADPTSHAIPADARAEAEQVFANLAAILAAAGAGLSDVVRVGIVMRDLQRDRPTFNAVWAERFGEHRPARSADPGRGLRPGRRERPIHDRGRGLPWLSRSGPMTDAPHDEIELRDGTRLVVRPIRPTDAAALEALHSRLSADTIYRRYFAARPHLAPATVDRFTRIDEPWRFALVAMREPGELVAVARYEGSEGSNSVELAMVVDDALQHRGVGRLMLGRLIDVAVERGVQTIEADVLAVNSPMLALLRALGLPVVVQRDVGYNHVIVDIPRRLDDPVRRARARAHATARL